MIIAVLCVLVVGTSRKMLSQVKSARCISNLRQIGVYMNIYLMDNRHRMFADNHPTNIYWGQNGMWLPALRKVADVATELPAAGVPEGSEFPLFICPADPTRGGWMVSGEQRGIPLTANRAVEGIKLRSYLPNRYILNQDVRKFPNPPERIIAFIDFQWAKIGTRAWWGAGPNWYNNYPDWHGDHLNCLLLDLSVRTLPISSIKPGGSHYSYLNPHYPSAFKTY